MGNKDRKKLDNILRETLTRHRLMLMSKLRVGRIPESPQPFTLNDLETFLLGINIKREGFQEEIQNVLHAVKTGENLHKPNTATPENQLIWGAALGYLGCNPDVMSEWDNPVEPDALRSSPLWKELHSTRHVLEEMFKHAENIRESLRDRETRYSWALPGKGFKHISKTNHIHIDLMQSLIVGFEHARSDVYREIGLSLLSKSMPQKMNELYLEMLPLLKKSQAAAGSNGKKKAPKLTQQEYKKLYMLDEEFNLRKMMFDAAEENVANRYVDNLGNMRMQDYGVSLNNSAVTGRGVGITILPTGDDVPEDLKKYLNLCQVVKLSFYQNNNLFEDTERSWKNVGVMTDWIRKIDTLKNTPEDTDGINHEDFKQLRDMCGGSEGLEHLQPNQNDRLFKNMMERNIAKTDKKRNEIVEDIWRLYAEDLIQNLLEQANDQIDQEIENAEEEQSQEEGQEGQDGQDGQEQDGEDQEGQEGQDGQEGQQQSQSGQEGKGESQKGEAQEGQGNQKGEQQDQDGQEQNKESQEGQEGQEQQDQQESEQGQGDASSDQADEDTVPVEDAGDMPAIDNPENFPGEEELKAEADGEGNDADGNESDGEESDGQESDGNDAEQGQGEDDGKTLEELQKEIEEKKAEEAAEQQAEEAGDDADGQEGQEGEANDNAADPGADSESKPSDKGGQDKGKSLEDLSKMDWTNYRQRISELRGPINSVRKLFKKVQERQLQLKKKRSRSLDIFPENGEVMDRFNMSAHMELTKKRAMKDVEEIDLHRFNIDERFEVPTEIDIVIMIDGSGSMRGVPLNSALQTAAILNEGASGKDMHINVWVSVWGNNTPPMIIKPGDNAQQIGRAMESARKGLNSGTDLSPAIKAVSEEIGEQRGRSGTLSGFTHILILSDGDIAFGDVEKSKDYINDLFRHCDKVTIDTAVIDGSKDSAMEKAVTSIKAQKKFQKVGVAYETDPNKIPNVIVGLLLNKIKKCGSFKAVPSSKKRRAMKKAANKMGKKR